MKWLRQAVSRDRENRKQMHCTGLQCLAHKRGNSDSSGQPGRACYREWSAGRLLCRSGWLCQLLCRWHTGWWKKGGSNYHLETAAECRFLLRRRKACMLQKQMAFHLFNWKYYAEESRKRTEREWCLGMRKRNRINSLHEFYSSFWKRTSGQGEPCWERACLA